MSKISDLIGAEVRSAERAPSSTDAELPADVKVTRGRGRSKVLQVRLNEDELRLLTKHAEEQMVPVSTLARAVLLRQIGL